MSVMTDRILDVAEECDVEGKVVNDSLVSFTFEADDSRQTVYVEHFERLDNDLNIVAFLAPCQGLDAEELKRFDDDQIKNLLRINARLHFGHFCLWEHDDNEFLTARTTEILESMESGQFVGNVETLAQLADSWEKKSIDDVQ
jgi:hypothetical protein